MEFKKIENEMKEIYYTTEKIEEDNSKEEYIKSFWNTMDLIAMQNLTYQRIIAA